MHGVLVAKDDEGTNGNLWSIALASLIDELFENASRNANDGPRDAPIDLNVIQTGEDIDNIGVSIKEQDETEDVVTNLINDDNSNDEDAVECFVGSTKRKINCRLAKVNKLCLTNIHLKGHEMMEKTNPKIMRFWKKKRNDRMNDFFKGVHSEYVKGDSNKCVKNAFSQLENKIL